jgi:hypothetical protein
MGGVFNIEMKVPANDTLCVFLLRKNELDLFTCLVWFLGRRGKNNFYFHVIFRFAFLACFSQEA